METALQPIYGHAVSLVGRDTFRAALRSKIHGHVMESESAGECFHNGRERPFPESGANQYVFYSPIMRIMLISGNLSICMFPKTGLVFPYRLCV